MNPDMKSSNGTHFRYWGTNSRLFICFWVLQLNYFSRSLSEQCSLRSELSDFKCSVLLGPLRLFLVKTEAWWLLKFPVFVLDDVSSFSGVCLGARMQKVWDSLCAKKWFEALETLELFCLIFFNCMKQVEKTVREGAPLSPHYSFSSEANAVTPCLETVFSNILSQWYGPLKWDTSVVYLLYQWDGGNRAGEESICDPTSRSIQLQFY